MSRPQTKGFQKPLDSGKRVEVVMAILHDQGSHATCNCGALFTQRRKKPREEAMQKHLDKKHEGQGLWL